MEEATPLLKLPLVLANEPNETYHSKQEFISASRLKTMTQSPLHFKEYHTTQAKKKSSPALIFGSALHTAFLEPDTFLDQYVITPKFDGRTTKGKEDKMKFEADNIGKILLDEGTHGDITGMITSLLNNEAILQIFSSGVAEESLYWQDEETSLLLKTRPDFRRFKNGIVADIKTTDDASPKAFARTVDNYDYPLQAALQTEGISICRDYQTYFYLYIAVEKTHPYACCVYRLPEEKIERARNLMREYFRKIKECNESGVWPGYESLPNAEKGIIEIELPNWSKYN